MLLPFLRNKVDNARKLPFLIVGLGNPGAEFRHNRHNVGFMLLDYLTNRLGESFSRIESNSLLTKANYQDKRLLLAKPQTFMNLSGQAVGRLVKYYKIPLESLLIVYDDVDLPLESIRIRPNGGSGGHNGVTSIIEHLGTNEFPRLRLGIGRPPGRKNATTYVLQDFTKEENEFLEVTLERAVDAVLLFVSAGLETAMNKYNETVL
ncbi:aminoacyl-tRNA hydrolase [Chloroflexota bacterium]